MLLFVFFYGIFVLYLFIGWKFLKYQPQKRTAPIHPSVTVIVPIRNESHHIERVLGDLQKQTNYNFQLLIVDDFSTDNSVAIVKSFLQESDLQATIIELKDYLPEKFTLSNNKKAAISEGVNQASGELIICIDGDVQIHERWFQSMVDYYSTYEVAFYSAPVLYTQQQSVFGKFLEVDQINNMAVTMATYQWNNPTMANGANMAFSKSCWKEVNGYEGIMKQASGDDMMLLHRMAHAFPAKIGFNRDRAAVIETNPVGAISEFIHQRVRWFGKIFHYESKSSILFLMMGLLFNGMVVYHMFFFSLHPMKSLLLLFVKMLSDTLFLASPLFYFRRQGYLVFIPLFSLFFSIYIVSMAFISPFVKYKWKTR